MVFHIPTKTNPIQSRSMWSPEINAGHLAGQDEACDARGDRGDQTTDCEQEHIPRDPVVPNLRFGTTGPSWHLHNSASFLTVPEVR